MRRAVALVLACLALFVAPALSPAAARAQHRDGGTAAQGETSHLAPADEHALAQTPDGGVAPTEGEQTDSEEQAHSSHESVADLPENLEERLYLRDRPDTLGTAARERQEAMIAHALEERTQLVVTRRNEAIALLDEFVQHEPENAVEMPDALLRLADLRWELAREQYLVAFAAWQAVPEENRSHDPPTPDYAPSMALYDRILTQHREFDRYDFVLYMKAYGLVEQGKSDEALALYRRILVEFPQSRFVADAHMALAESFFNGQSPDYAQSLAEYELVMQHPDSELYDIALFKSAWCLWRLNRSREAALRFKQVLDLGQNTRGMNTQQRRRVQELQNEALDYLIQVFTEDESNTANDVFRFLQEIGGERYAKKILARLSDTFYDQARYDRATEAYTLLLQMDPQSEHAPDWQAQIATAYAALDDAPHNIEALRVLATTYGATGTWAQGQGDPAIVEHALRISERNVRRQALKYHQMAQRDHQMQKYSRAADLYRIYLQAFPDSDQSYDIHFFLAEILFHRLEGYEEAGREYLAAAHKNPHGQYTRDALYNAIGAFEHVREVEIQHCRGATAGGAAADAGAPTHGGGHAGHGAASPPDAGVAAAVDGGAADGAAAEPVTPCGESENDRKFAEAIDLYIQLYPTDPDLPEILFRQGKLYYDNGIYDPAVRLWGQLLEKYPQSQYANPAGELILDSFNRAQDFGNIETWARRLKSAPAFQSAESQTRLDGLILQSVFKLGEQLATRGQHAEAANAYYRAAEEFPHDARARQAYFNAGIERQRAGDLPGAAQAYDRLIELHPGSTEGALGAWTTAQMYESIAQFSDAARYYETYATKFPQGPKAQDALYNAVLLRVTAGDTSPAVTDGQDFVRRFPHTDVTDDVYFLIGRAYETGQDWTNAANTYREFIRRTHDNNRKAEAQCRLGQVLLHANDKRGADAAFDAAVALGRHNAGSMRDGLYYSAQARYLQGDAVLADFAAITIEGDVATLAARLQHKMQLLTRAAGVYGEVVEFHVAEWVTAALFQIGHIYEEFADSLRNAPVPPEIRTDEERQSYQDQLAGFVVPVEDRALEAYTGGYQKAIELHIYNDWTAKLHEALTRLNDVEFPPLREIGGDIVTNAPLPQQQPLEGLHRGVDTGDVQLQIAPPVQTGGAAATAAANAAGGGAPPAEATVNAPATPPPGDEATSAGGNTPPAQGTGRHGRGRRRPR